MAKRNTVPKAKIEILLEVWVCGRCKIQNRLEETYETRHLDMKTKKCELCGKDGLCYLLEIGRKKN